MTRKITIRSLRIKKEKSEKIVALTAYDYPTASLLDSAGIDIILVGDSLGMAFRGEANTLGVTVDEIAYHLRAVKRGITKSLLVGDMPFLSYHVSEEESLRNAGTLISAGAEAIKVEGAGDDLLRTIGRFISAGMAVMGHVGLTPQSLHQFGGFRVQGRSATAARKIVEQAKALESAGVFAIVLECIPEELAEQITEAVSIPTIGIGAGLSCDGQILVLNDMLGLNDQFQPKFVKRYAHLSKIISGAVAEYITETKDGIFPGVEQRMTADKSRQD